ncbi:hypothetical protein [Aeromonas caviae]|uniref:hypothetical protein n=1 Tax=Aeromonas caviae TaxID=648 RepID=UPI00403F855A
MSMIPNNIAVLNDEELERVCKLLCSTYSGWVRLVAKNPGIRTHEIPAAIKPSNNPAGISRMLNKKLLPIGLQIEKQVLTKPNESWGWFLVELPAVDGKAA